MHAIWYPPLSTCPYLQTSKQTNKYSHLQTNPKPLRKSESQPRFNIKNIRKVSRLLSFNVAMHLFQPLPKQINKKQSGDESSSYVFKLLYVISKQITPQPFSHLTNEIAKTLYTKKQSSAVSPGTL